jgi:hypothetical protein
MRKRTLGKTSPRKPGRRRSSSDRTHLRTDHHPAGGRLPAERCDQDACREEWLAERNEPRHGCAHLIRDGHARQLPSRPPDHWLPIRHGHNVQRPNRNLLLFATVCKSGADDAEP